MVRAAAVVFLAGVWIGLAGPALAVAEPVTGTCDALLVDAADELSPAEETEVQAAAGTLRTDTSFEPRVWVLTQEQDGRDLAEWIELQTDACDTWHAGVSDSRATSSSWRSRPTPVPSPARRTSGTAMRCPTRWTSGSPRSRPT